ncbi:EpsG family protein [Aquimarina sp. W85]|uniref:EpsG family protein n=1 Tax=Aquimarina rhodophyticola TaxID=3342246 RepID=UPI00366A6BE7
MIDFVPLQYYYSIYINITFVIILLTVLHTLLLDINDKKNLIFTNSVGVVVLIFSIFYIGLRPVSGFYFTDMATYARHFEYYQFGGALIEDKDIFFHLFMKFLSQFLSIHSFFLFCVFIYIFPMYRVSKRFFENYWFYAFIMLVTSFSFWPYAVNGIRNGMATSLFLLALSYYDRKMIMILCFALSALFHQTLLLPIIAYIVTLVFKNSKWYLIGWILAIPMSIAFGGIWESLFMSLGFGDDRLESYLSSPTANSGGFRYDFLLYSASAVFSGWYFLFRKGFKDPLYSQIFNIYLTANAFWILVIRANFSNRFAYLSWFLMALVIIYPFLKQSFFVKQHVVIGRVVLVYFAFTYLMFYVYYS